jgi:hypothetical protein
MSSISAGTATGTALVSTGDTTGALVLQVNGTTPSVTLAANGSIGVGSTPGYGTNGQVLTSSGTGSAPTWTTLSTTPTTAQVLTATAGLTFGEIGSYAFLGQQTAAALEPGDTQAGSELRFVGIRAGAAPGSTTVSGVKGSSTNLPTGTWRCLGYADGGANFYYTLFLRIS